MSKILNLDAEVASGIKCIDNGNPLDSVASEKMDSFKYRRYRFNGVYFTIREDEGFKECLDNGEVYSAKLIEGTRKETVDGLERDIPSIEFDSFISARKKIGIVKMLGTVTQLEASYRAPLVTVTAADLAGAVKA